MVSDHGAYTLRTSARLDQSLRRPISTQATSAAVSTRRMASPSSTRSWASANSSGVHPPSGPIAIRRSADRHGSTTRLGRHALGKHVRRRERTGDLGEPNPPRLHQRLGRDPRRDGRVPRRSVAVPPHDGAFGMQEHDAIDPELGRLLDEPLRPILLGDRDRDRATGHGRVGRRPRHRSRGRWRPAMWQVRHRP